MLMVINQRIIILRHLLKCVPWNTFGLSVAEKQFSKLWHILILKITKYIMNIIYDLVATWYVQVFMFKQFK